MARLNSPHDRFVCPECGGTAWRWQVEQAFRSSDGKNARIIVRVAEPMCEHEDGSRWEMRLEPSDH